MEEVGKADVAKALTLSDHRVIYNGDWGAMFWAPNLWQPQGGSYTAEAIHNFIQLLADSRVDTFAISPNTQIAWYPSRAVPTALDGYSRGNERWSKWMRAHPPHLNLAMMDRYLDLVETGVDWLAEAISASHRRGIAPWISVRTNDPHGYLEKWVDNPINCPLFKDPANRLQGTPLRPGKHADVLWVGLNYERREVRDYFTTMIRELVVDYDAQGLELDFLRTPAICEPGASQDTIDVISAWIGEIRDLTQRKAEETGRPYPLGLRIPAALGALRAIGLDVQALVEAGRVDFLSFSNYMQTGWDLPLDELRRQVGSSVKLYGNVECGLNGLPVCCPDEVEEAGHPQLDAAPRKGTQMRCPYVVTQALLGAVAGRWALGAGRWEPTVSSSTTTTPRMRTMPIGSARGTTCRQTIRPSIICTIWIHCAGWTSSTRSRRCSRLCGIRRLTRPISFRKSSSRTGEDLSACPCARSPVGPTWS